MEVNVGRGDTLFGLLRNHGVPEAQLRAAAEATAILNGLANPNRLLAGARLTIPDRFLRVRHGEPFTSAPPGPYPGVAPGPDPGLDPGRGGAVDVGRRGASSGGGPRGAATRPVVGSALGLGLRVRAQRLSSGYFKTQPGQERRELMRLIQQFAEQTTDLEQHDWLRENCPSLYASLERLPTSALANGLRDPETLRPFADQLAEALHASRRRTGWDEAGYDDPYYARTTQSLLENTGSASITRRAGRLCFGASASAYRKIVPTVAGLNVEDDIEAWLRKLGVDPVHIEVENGAVDGDGPNTRLYLDVQDAALLLDASSPFAENAARLVGSTAKGDGWAAFRRLRTAPDEAPTNVFVLPEASYLGLSSVAEDVERGSDVSSAILRCLTERGVERPSAQRITIAGQSCIAMTPEDARILLPPAAPGDRAARLSLVPPPYDPSSRGFDLHNAEILTEAAKVAYSDPATIASYAAAWGFTKCAAFSHGPTDAQGFVAYDPGRNVVLVAFRGTESFSDVLADLSFLGADGSLYGGGRIHHGFVRQIEGLLTDTALMSTIDGYRADGRRNHGAEPAIMVGGHSLGGALATLFSSYCLNHDLRIAQLYTCGQPAVGDGAFNAGFERNLARLDAQYYRLVNNSDVVPHLLPGGVHLPLVAFIDQFGRLLFPGPLAIVRNQALNLFRALDDHSVDAYLELIRKNKNPPRRPL
ncbi:MAG: LysM peptidoglycan-binding domain-containing protein [Deltaproteobacteria bacterium]|nr:LysM peptidoglycan-binding domain-containing protein [Deltaproteobacteria bacterium]